MDILMGVITPLSAAGSADGSAAISGGEDLVISMRAMNLYAQKRGLTQTNAYAMSYEALKAMYNSACPSSIQPPPSSCASFRAIAHIDGNHYIIITKVTDSEVTYTDPGAGPESALDQVTLSKEEFLKTWGVVSPSTLNLPPSTAYGYILTAHVPSQDSRLTTQDSSVTVLDATQQQKVRGAFFGFIGKVFKAVWEFVVNTVKAVVTFVVEVVKGIVNSIVHFAQGIANLFVGLFTGDFSRALHGLNQMFVQSTGDVIGGFTNGVVKGAYQHVGTLEAIGFSERTAEKIIATQIAGVKVAGGVALTVAGITTANPYLVGTGISLVGGGAGDILRTHTNLSPKFIQMVEIGAQAIGVMVAGGISPDLTALGALKVAAPSLSREFAMAGLVAGGNALGVSPMVTGLVSIPISAGFGSGIETFTRGGVNAATLFGSIKNGLLAGAKSIGFDLSGQSGISGLGALSTKAVTESIESSLGANGLFSEILGVVKTALLAPINFVSGAAKLIMDGATNFNTLIQQKGLVGAFEQLAASIFSRKTVEEIVKAGGMSGFLGSAEKLTATFNGQQAEEWRFGTSGTSLFFNAVGQLIGKQENGITQSGTFGVSNQGKWGLISGFVNAALGNDYTFSAQVSNGQWSRGLLANASGTVAEFNPEDGSDAIQIDGSQVNTPNSTGGFWSGIIGIVQWGMNFSVKDGHVKSAEVQTPSVSTGNGQGVSTDWLYALINGIGGNTSVINPISNLEWDLGALSGGQVQSGQDTIKSDPFGGNLFGEILGGAFDKAEDVVQWLRQAQSPFAVGVAVARIIADFTAHYFTAPQDTTRPIVAMAYSGGLLPLATAIINQQYKAETLVGLGAATTIFNLSDQDLQKLLEASQAGLVGLAAELLRNTSAGIPDLTGTSVKQIVNAWGTEDALAKAGIVGYRATIGGVTAINIEIQGANHFDYMRRPDETDPVKKNFNERVSQFVAELILASKNQADIVTYLQQKGARLDPADGIWRYLP